MEELTATATKVADDLALAKCYGLTGAPCNKCKHALLEGEIIGWIGNTNAICQKCLGDKVLKYVW